MFQIQTLNSISDKIYGVLDEENYEVTADCAAPDAILVRSFNMTDYDIQGNLLAIGRAGAGVNNIPIPRMTDAGICVFNTPGANANAVKELTLCGLLLASRGILRGIRWESSLAGKGAEVPKLVEKGKGQFGGTELAGKTLGVIGLGAIGVKVANAAFFLDMKVMGSDPFITPEHKALLNENVELASFEEIVAKADYISFHIPLTDSTRGIISAKLIEGMKDGVILLNMSRAELANIADVKAGIASGKVRTYVVDFPTEDTLDTEGIIAIPHLGASTEEAEENCAVMAADQLKNYLEDGNVVNSVNFPCLSVPRTTRYRLTVVYNAVGDLIERLEEALAGTEYILNHAVRKDLGYAIIDTEQNLADSTETGSAAERIAELDDVIGIRVL